MSRDYFVEPDADTWHEDADSEALVFAAEPAKRGEAWIELKRKLNYGEQQRLLAGLMKRMPLSMLTGKGGDADLDVSVAVAGSESILAWVVGWSFKDRAGKAVDVSRKAIEALDPEVADAISNAITLHAGVTDEEKKAPSGNRHARRAAAKSP